MMSSSTTPVFKGGCPVSKSPNQKLKLLHLQRILCEHTDEKHPMTLSEMQAALAAADIAAERKSLYDDIESLRRFGLDIVDQRRGATTVYFVGSRPFETAELKLLVDSVQCSRFITQKKSLRLIQKIEGLTNRWEAQSLRRQVYMLNRIKTFNESIYYNVDIIHTAIANNRKIRFQYFEYTLDKQQRLRRGGQFYQISPIALTWDDEKYYLIGHESESALIKHFRVDKMLRLIECDLPRDDGITERFDIAIIPVSFFQCFQAQSRQSPCRWTTALSAPLLTVSAKI
jgi:predicted DNA-binding transcriptional regulator YafY